MSEAVEKLEGQINGIFDRCYIKGSPNYPKLLIFQRQKALNQILALIKEAGYIPVELVQLEMLGDKEIRYKLEEIQPEGFDWTDITDTEMIKFRAISQATITHNEAKGQLYRVKGW